MLIRNAVQKDLPQIMKIYENARSYMRKTGNPTQWSGGYPGEGRDPQRYGRRKFLCL